MYQKVQHYVNIAHLQIVKYAVVQFGVIQVLIELCGIERLPIRFGKKGKVRIRVSHIHPTHDGRSGYNHYDSLIDCIEWLIGEGYFNKDYLEEK